MKSVLKTTLLAAAVLMCVFSSRLLFAQACQDEESFVADYKKGLIDFVETVKKESLGDFQKAYHQRSCLTKLTLSLGAVNGLLTCLEKAAQDPAATKEQADAYKSKHETYGKLKEKIDKDRNSLKATESAKDAKPLIEKFDFSQ